MKRALAWIAGVAGIAALGRAVSRRRDAPRPAAGAGAAAADPAEQLRRTLAARRGDEAPAEPSAGEPAETLEQRRARVHAKAQEAIDTMREPGTDG